MILNFRSFLNKSQPYSLALELYQYISSGVRPYNITDISKKIKKINTNIAIQINTARREQK